MMTIELFFDMKFDRSYKKIKSDKEREKVRDSFWLFRVQGSGAAHFKYITEIDKKLKAKGRVLGG